MAVKFFGQFLIQKGEISVDQLREALDLMESRNRSFCDMAVEKGLLTVEQSETLKSLESNTPTTASQAAAEEGFFDHRAGIRCFESSARSTYQNR